MKIFRYFVIGLFLLAIVIIQWRYGKNHQTPEVIKSTSTSINLAMDWTPNTNHTGIYVAQALGWYKNQGIDLTILPYSSEVSSSVLITNGKADVGITSIEDIIGETAKNNPIVSIGAVLQHNTSGFIVLADSGISRPKDLDGKIYAGFGSPFENAVVTEIIKKDGGRGNFKNITLDVKAMQALESKRVDFVWVLEGWEVIQAKLDGFRVNFFPLIKYGIPDSPTLAFVATPKVIQEKPQMLQKFMNATAKGFEYAKLHPKESAQILINNTPKDTFPDLKLVFESQDFLSSKYADLGQKWGVQDSKGWHEYGQFMLDSNSITDPADKPVKTLNFESLFTNKFLP